MSKPELSPALLTIFGITGDLSRRKLLPSLYHLAKDGLLPKTFRIVGITRKAMTVDEVLERIKTSVEASGNSCDQEILEWLASIITIIEMDLTKADDYARLKTELDATEDEIGVCLNRLFYLAIPSTIFAPIVEQLGNKQLNTGCQHGTAESRLLIEKPFGYDLASAEELMQMLGKSFDEEQIFRIDHYLTKETAQNIVTLRFENPLFHSTFNKAHIHRVMITAAEEIGIEGRAAFYEQMGALRDLIQSHLLQLLALVAMEQPQSRDTASIHAAKYNVLKNVLSPHPDEMANKAIRGQYQSYKDEVDNHNSNVETFAAIEFAIDNDRWRGVPFFVRTGKSLKEKVTEITLVYNSPDLPDCENYLTIRIQPNEGIVLDLRIKKPGFAEEIEHIQMDFCYHEQIDAMHPDAYERVLVDAIRGDKTLFATRDEVLENWRIVQPILHAWQNNLTPLHVYQNNSWGPEAADTLIKAHGGTWLNDNRNVCSVHILPSDHNE
ncbi:MAG: glucose-6-phosphate dehydrogenase [Candidatus Saccharimonadales bacterium]